MTFGRSSEELDEYDEVCADDKGLVLIKWGAAFEGPHLIDTRPRPRTRAELMYYIRKARCNVQLLSGSYVDHLKDMAIRHFNIDVCVN